MNYQATATFPQPFESPKGAIVVKQWFQIRLLRLEIKDQFFKGQSPVPNSPFGSKNFKAVVAERVCYDNARDDIKT